MLTIFRNIRLALDYICGFCGLCPPKKELDLAYALAKGPFFSLSDEVLTGNELEPIGFLVKSKP
jgi:hypothetical protein